MVVVFLVLAAFQPTASAYESRAREPVVIGEPQEAVATKESFQKPLEGPIYQGFHWGHRAIDIGGRMGEPIRPIAEGVVIEVSFGRVGWGNTVVIVHKNGFTSRYAHLGKIEVEEGDWVERETKIGEVGMTGWTTGPHLHLEVLREGKPIDPQEILPRFGRLLAKG